MSEAQNTKLSEVIYLAKLFQFIMFPVWLQGKDATHLVLPVPKEQNCL